MSLLVLNAGSSSLKFQLFDNELTSQLSGQVDWRGGKSSAELILQPPNGPEHRQDVDVRDSAAAAELLFRDEIGDRTRSGLLAIGHRVVHGGTRFQATTRIDDAVEGEIQHLVELAPLHNPPALAVIEAAKRARPGVPQFAVFDTQFYAHLPEVARTYAVPRSWTKDQGIRKFGFHGISHAYCAGRASEILGRDPKALRLVVCHLGNGCSATAIAAGQPVDTTMGFTPLAGLVMGTRSGDVDPGVLLYLLRERGFTAERIDDELNHASGLLGVSGVSSDYRAVEKAAGAGNADARLALEIYATRVRAKVGALAATLGGLDALVFAAGVGENSASLRASVCENLGFLGVKLDPGLNAGHPVDADIATVDSPVRVLVIHTQEELMIAREVLRKLGTP
jgi:acetate kinase